MKIKTIYVATDGKEFTDQEACKDWEKAYDLRKALEDIYIAWPGGEETAGKSGWVNHITKELLKNFHTVKRGQTSSNRDDN